MELGQAKNGALEDRRQSWARRPDALPLQSVNKLALSLAFRSPLTADAAAATPNGVIQGRGPVLVHGSLRDAALLTRAVLHPLCWGEGEAMLVRTGGCGGRRSQRSRSQPDCPAGRREGRS